MNFENSTSAQGAERGNDSARRGRRRIRKVWNEVSGRGVRWQESGVGDYSIAAGEEAGFTRHFCRERRPLPLKFGGGSRGEATGRARG